MNATIRSIDLSTIRIINNYPGAQYKIQKPTAHAFLCADHRALSVNLIT